MTETVMKLSYLLGVADPVLEKKYDWDGVEFKEIEDAGIIRACCRARQVVLFQLSNGKRFFALPDTLRTYCPEGYYEELRETYSAACYPHAFVNEMTSRIMTLLPKALEDMGIPHGTVLMKVLFYWPIQTKQSLSVLSTQYHSKKFVFPLQVFLPKPSSFGQGLKNLFDKDQNLWQSPPIKLALAAETEGQTEGEGDGTCNACGLATGAHYIDQTFDPSLIHHNEGVQVSYVDFDNIPEFVIAQLCSHASSDRRVKIFYDDRPKNNINLYENQENVELIYVERLLAQKSLVDTGIMTTALADLYDDTIQQAVLYSSDSDFYALAKQYKKSGKDFSVVGLERNMSSLYIERLTAESTCYVLSDKAATPTVDKTLIMELLLKQLANGPLAKLTLHNLTNDVLCAMSEEKYHALLSKDVSSTIEQLMEHISFRFVNGVLRPYCETEKP